MGIDVTRSRVIHEGCGSRATMRPAGFADAGIVAAALIATAAAGFVAARVAAARIAPAALHVSNNVLSRTL